VLTLLPLGRREPKCDWLRGVQRSVHRAAVGCVLVAKRSVVVHAGAAQGPGAALTALGAHSVLDGTSLGQHVLHLLLVNVHGGVSVQSVAAVVRPQHSVHSTLVRVQGHELADLDVAAARELHAALREELPEIGAHYARGDAVLQLERREQQCRVLAHELAELGDSNLGAQLLEYALRQLLGVGIILVVLAVDVTQHLRDLAIVDLATVVSVVCNQRGRDRCK
jgi:hypothetical protein